MLDNGEPSEHIQIFGQLNAEKDIKINNNSPLKPSLKLLIQTLCNSEIVSDKSVVIQIISNS